MLLDRLITKRQSIENPSIPITDPGIWARYFGSRQTDSGLTINVDSMMSYSPIWCGVRMIACDVAKIPLFVYRREGQGKDRAQEHPAYRLLRRQANPEMTANTWKQIVLTHALIYGRSYSWIKRNQGAEPVELLPLDPDRIKMYRAPNGSLRYIMRFPDRPDIPAPLNLPARDVFVIIGLTLDGLNGMSLIEYARNSIGRGLAAEKYSNRFFRNNARPGGILVHPHRLDERALSNLRDSFASMQEGLDNAHRFAILEEGMQWIQTGLDPEKSQLIASLEFGVKDAARILGIPSHRLGDNTKTSFASLEQENLSYQDSSLGPWFDKIQEESYSKLLSLKEQQADSHTIEFKRERVLQADAKSRHEIYHIGLQDGFYNRDEIRAWENLNPLPDGEGQKYYVPMNMGMAGEEEEAEDEDSELMENEDEPESDGDDSEDRAAIIESQESLMRDAALRAGRRLAHYFSRASKSTDQFCREIDEIARHEGTIAMMFGPAVNSAMAVGLACPSAAEMSQRYLDMWHRAMDGIARVTDQEHLQQATEEVIETLLTSEVKVFVNEETHDGMALQPAG